MQDRLARALPARARRGGLAVSVTAGPGEWTQDAVISQYTGPPKVRAAPARKFAMRRRGPDCRGFPRPAGYGIGAVLNITCSCVYEPKASCMTPTKWAHQ